MKRDPWFVFGMILGIIVVELINTMLLTIPTWAVFNWKVASMIGFHKLDMDDVFFIVLVVRMFTWRPITLSDDT